jgi:hypothetical protein
MQECRLILSTNILRRQKQDTPIISTNAGMHIEVNEEQLTNADLAIAVSLQPDPKVTVERRRHASKH